MSAKYPFDAVLFDMDGVIIDNTPLHQAVWIEFARSHGITLSDADILATNGRRAVDIVIQLFGSQLDPQEASRLATQRSLLYRQYLKTIDIKEVSGVKQFLQRLNSLEIPCILATSSNRDNVTIVLNRLQVDSYFDAVISAQDVCNGKPHPEIYLTAAEKAGAEPLKCLVVEDAIPGVKAAKAAGCRCLGLTTSQSKESLIEVGADWVAPDFMNLPKLLQI